MRLDREASSAENLVFDYLDGTNLDPAVDVHIHDSKIVFTGEDSLESWWTGWVEGKPAAVMRFVLSREGEG